MIYLGLRCCHLCVNANKYLAKLLTSKKSEFCSVEIKYNISSLDIAKLATFGSSYKNHKKSTTDAHDLEARMVDQDNANKSETTCVIDRISNRQAMDLLNMSSATEKMHWSTVQHNDNVIDQPEPWIITISHFYSRKIIQYYHAITPLRRISTE